MREINTVIFDIGRVLVRIVTTGRKFGALMRAIGVRPDEAFEKFWYAPEIRQFMTGDIDALDFHMLVNERFALDMPFDEFADAWCDLFQPMPGAEEIFRRVAERYKVGLLSDTDPLHWLKIRDMFSWLRRVKKPTLSYEVGHLKPHPAMFAAAAANCDSDPANCLFIDDVLENVDGARYSGMPALQFTDSAKLIRDLGDLGVWR